MYEEYYMDNGYYTHKFVIAVNKSLEMGVAMNACSHLALGIVAKADDELRKEMKFVTYVDGEGREHPFISMRSMIILRASAGELRKFARECQEKDVLSLDFLETMTGNWEDQLERTKQTKGEEILPYAVACFGKKEVIDPLTKRMSLWK
jgi:hypothetical protein